MTVNYEWVIEWLDGPDTEDGDAEIKDVNHADTYIGALEFAAGLDHSRIALVRDSDDDNRAWAYIENGELPTHLEDAFGRRVREVPKRYRTQFASLATVGGKRRPG